MINDNVYKILEKYKLTFCKNIYHDSIDDYYCYKKNNKEYHFIVADKVLFNEIFVELRIYNNQYTYIHHIYYIKDLEKYLNILIRKDKLLKLI